MFDQFYTTLESLGIVPVVVLDKVEDAAPLAHALMAAGMKSAEVTFRTACAAECIAAMAEAEPEMCVGAGTVLTVEQVEQARAAGAKFIVSPGYNEDVVKHCIDIELPVLPGTVTPSEVTAAENLGLKVTKFFPASQYGGLNTIKALAGSVCRSPLYAYRRREHRQRRGVLELLRHHRLRWHLDGQAGPVCRRRLLQGRADRPRGHGRRQEGPRLGLALYRERGRALDLAPFLLKRLGSAPFPSRTRTKTVLYADRT